MGEIDGMADVGTDACGGEWFVLAAGENFGESAELGKSELVVGEFVEEESCREK
jgi:hypothetical protein